MNFELTPEQQTLQNAAIEFARRDLNGNMIERDAQQVFSHEGWKKCAAFGVEGMPIPRDYGRKDGSDYVLNGRKIFVTNAPVADLFTLYVTLDLQLGAAGICALIVEKGTRGLSVGKKKDKLGLRTALMAELLLEDCRVPGTALLGREGRGRWGLQLFHRLGASLYPGDLSWNDATPARTLHRTRTEAQASASSI
jgi:alkylation response protein AidB-like acyl-CoA dehydrogenase